MSDGGKHKFPYFLMYFQIDERVRGSKVQAIRGKEFGGYLNMFMVCSAI